MLRGLSGALGQGYLFDKPLSAEQIPHCSARHCGYSTPAQAPADTTTTTEPR